MQLTPVLDAERSTRLTMRAGELAGLAPAYAKNRTEGRVMRLRIGEILCDIKDNLCEHGEFQSIWQTAGFNGNTVKRAMREYRESKCPNTAATERTPFQKDQNDPFGVENRGVRSVQSMPADGNYELEDGVAEMVARRHEDDEDDEPVAPVVAGAATVLLGPIFVSGGLRTEDSGLRSEPAQSSALSPQHSPLKPVQLLLGPLFEEAWSQRSLIERGFEAMRSGMEWARGSEFARMMIEAGRLVNVSLSSTAPAPHGAGAVS